MVTKPKRKSARNKKSEPNALKKAAVGFRLAWCFFTRVPLPEARAPLKRNAKLANAALFFAPVGFVIGCGAGAALWLAHWIGLPPLAVVLLALAVAALVSGALHEDGLADVADGFWGGTTKARKLAIMKDSRIGTYGVLVVVFFVGLKAAFLLSMGIMGAIALVVAHTLSRAGLPMMMARLKPVRKSGLAKAAGKPRRDEAAIAALLGLLLALFIAGPTLGYGAVLGVALIAGLGFEAVGWLAHRHIGGITGDVLGAAQQVAELLVLFGFSVLMGGVV